MNLIYTASLTSLANVKQYLAIANTADDGILARLIPAASTMIQDVLGRVFASTWFDEIYDGNNSAKLIVVNYPVTAVSSVTIDGDVIPVSTGVKVNGYSFNVFSIFLRGYIFTQGLQNVEVNYTAGYTTTPYDVEQECIRLVSLMYKQKERIGVSGKGIGPEHISYDLKDQADKIKTNLRHYIR